MMTMMNTTPKSITKNPTMNTLKSITTTHDSSRDPFSEIELHTIQHEGRDIAYSTSPDNRASHTVLYFYPGGGNRRMIFSFRNLFSSLRFICVNRPGKGGTSPAEKSGAANHLTTTVQDAIVVLDTLGIEKVSLLCMCAGTPFCMTFAARYPERTTGKFTGISSWIQPADCGYENTKTTLYLGTQMRPIVAPVVGMVFTSIGASLTSFPSGMTIKALSSKLSEEERESFDEKYKNREEFSRMMKWMQGDRGGYGSDMSVLFSANLVDYQAFNDSQKSIVLWHGTRDNLVPYTSAEWLVEEVLTGATLNPVVDGTHEGGNFLLHSSLVEYLKGLGRVEMK